jgi:hypothetical protein
MKGPKMPSLPPAGSGSITLDQPSPALGDTVTFTVTGTGTLKNPRVWVAAYQDGNLVYGEGGGPAMGFKLGGDSSLWLEAGGPADCTAELYYILNKNGTGEWNGHGDQGGNVTLATTSFSALG